MQSKGLPGLLVVVALFAGAVFWMLSGDSGAPGLTPGAGPDPAAAAKGTATPVAGDGVAEAALAPDADERVAAPAVAGTQTEDAESAHALIGRVVDEQGAPIAGARVIATPTMSFDYSDFELMNDPAHRDARIAELVQQRSEAATGDDGAFRLLPRGKRGSLEVRVLAQSYALANQSTRRPVEADVDLGDIKLVRGAVVTGRVVTREGTPVPGARIDRRRPNEGQQGFAFFGFDAAELRPGDEAETDAEGRFELDHVRPGSFALRARHEDHPTARLEGLAAEPGQTLADVTVVVPPGATIRGTVRDLPADRAGLRVLAATRGGQEGPTLVNELGALYAVDDPSGGGDYGRAERTAEIAADGTFCVRGLTIGGAYGVWVAQSGRGFVASLPCSRRAEVAAGAQGVELRFEAGVTVTLQVVDARTHLPIEELVVRDRIAGGAGMFFGTPDGPRPRQYPEGRVVLANLRPKPKQTLSLTIESPGYAKLEREGIALPTLGALDLGRVELAPVPVVDVTVTTNFQPVADARVSLRVERDGEPANPFARAQPGAVGSTTGRTDAEGQCRINSLPGRPVRIRVDHPEFAPFASEVLDLPDAGVFRYAVRLTLGGSVEVTVVDADGKPAPKVRISHRDPRESQDERSTDAAGKVVFDRLAPGEHSFRARERGPMAEFRMWSGEGERVDASWTKTEVAEGASTKLLLTQQPTASVSGVVRANGRPVANATIMFLEGPGDGSDRDLRMQRVADQMAEFAGDLGARSDEQGNYLLRGGAPGEHRLRVTHKDWHMASTVPVSLRAGENAFDIDVEAAVLRGTVRGPDGQPVAEASVTVGLAQTSAREIAMPWGDRGRAVKTDAQGVFELRGLQVGVPLAVHARAKGLAPTTSAPIEVARGETREGVDLQLGAAGKLHVMSSADVRWASIMATAEGGPPTPPVYQQFRKEGVTLEGLRPGRWRVQFQTPDRQYDPLVVEVVAGRTTEVTF